ncbi:MAG: hypothetical protein ACYTEQ_01560 [Planctomycetota bacterium]|jgi:hypothetical protein
MLSGRRTKLGVLLLLLAAHGFIACAVLLEAGRIGLGSLYAPVLALTGVALAGIAVAVYGVYRRLVLTFYIGGHIGNPKPLGGQGTMRLG